MKAGRGWSINGPIRRADSAKTPWQSMPVTRWMESYSFVPSASTTPSIVRPVRRNLRIMRNKSQKISASVLRSGKRSLSRPLQIVPHYGAKAGKPNPRFLDAGVFRDLVWGPAHESLRSKLGPFIFEFQRWGMEPAAFLDALDRFLGTLPLGPQYATEIRNPAILGSRYLNILRAHQVSHVYNHWTAMPALSEQLSPARADVYCSLCGNPASDAAGTRP